MLLKDCKNFPGDRPCIYHKEENIKCDNYNYYSPLDKKILIIKLEAIGDVLRTTSILPPLKNKYPDTQLPGALKLPQKNCSGIIITLMKLLSLMRMLTTD